MKKNVGQLSKSRKNEKNSQQPKLRKSLHQRSAKKERTRNACNLGDLKKYAAHCAIKILWGPEKTVETEVVTWDEGQKTIGEGFQSCKGRSPARTGRKGDQKSKKGLRGEGEGYFRQTKERCECRGWKEKWKAKVRRERG